MGTPDSRYLSNLDYGRRLYVDDAPYAKQMGVGSRKPAFNQNDALYKQSEFKKPYKEDDYEEMEEFADSFPGFSYDYNFDTPFVPGINNLAGGFYFNLPDWPCTVSLSFCYTDEYTCHSAVGSIYCEAEILGFANLKKPPGCIFKFEGGQICISCPDGTKASEPIEFDVVLRAKKVINGVTTFQYFQSHIIIPLCLEGGVCANCILAYDYENSAETIAQSSSTTVFFTCEGAGENDYYTYSVSGTGFWLDADYTITEALIQGLSVTVYTDADACGSGTITAQCIANAPATGYVRCTTGQWDDANPVKICSYEGNPNVCYSSGATGGCFDGLIVGAKRWLTGCNPYEGTCGDLLAGTPCGWGDCTEKILSICYYNWIC